MQKYCHREHAAYGGRYVTRLGHALRYFAFVCVVVLPAACSDVPKEAVTLSVTVGKDIAEAHRAHRALAERYFGTMRADVDSFIDDVYRPYVIRDVLNRTAPGGSATIWERIVAQGEAAKRGDPDARPLDFMSSTVSLITDEIAQVRRELMTPVAAQEAEVLRAIDDSYNRIQQGQAVVTAHLAAVRRVQETQDEIAEEAGFGNLRRDVIDKTADASDRIAEIVEKARRADEKADEALEQIKSVLEKVRE